MVREIPVKCWSDPLCALFPAILFLSCGLESLSVHTLILENPGRPEVWPGRYGIDYAVLWKDENGSERRAIAESGETLAIRVRRGQAQAILAIPFREGAAFFPAGALYPFDLETGTGVFPSSRPDRLRLDFESGYPAATARFIEKAGYDPWLYPLLKLKFVRDERERDPWGLAPWKAANALIEGSFRMSMFPSGGEAIVLPPGSPWWPESPLCRTEFLEDSQKACLPEGLHLFYGEKEKLAVNIREGKATFQRTAFAGGGRVPGQASGLEFEQAGYVACP